MRQSDEERVEESKQGCVCVCVCRCLCVRCVSRQNEALFAGVTQRYFTRLQPVSLGKVVTWGSSNVGGDSSSVVRLQSERPGCRKQIFFF